MCGIAGIVDYKKTPLKDNPLYRDMLNSMENRGPDQEGLCFAPPAVLLHKRLSVIDPECSRQPMSKTFGGENYTIIYNGEVYNTDELKKDLLSHGFTFETTGDTEIVLLSYICYGEECVNKINGIFAFAIWQEKEQRLFFARDAMGVKPFFYSARDGFFAFASTVPTLLKHPDIKPTINYSSVAEIILLGPGLTVGSGVFTSISSLPRGCMGTFDNKNGLKIKEYFTLTDKPNSDSFEETVKKVNFLVTDAIKRQMVSDVPIGTFLSGGLDSSIISAVAAEEMRKHNKTLDTFSVTYKDNEKYFKSSHFQPDSDDTYVEMMVNAIKSNHHCVVLDTDFIISALYDVIDEKGLPSMADVDSSLLLFCKEIKKHVTVALSGECADETVLTC